MTKLVDVHPFVENQPDNRTHYYIDLDDIFSVIIESYEYQGVETDRIELHFKSRPEVIELSDLPAVRALLGL